MNFSALDYYGIDGLNIHNTSLKGSDMARTRSTDVQELTQALVAAARAFLEALPDDLADTTSAGAESTRGNKGAYDPLFDRPPLRSDPIGSAAEKKMASLAYLAGIGRINAEHGRGATSEEVAEMARRAGYPDGRAVSGWNSRAGSPRVIDNVEGARVLNASGHAYIAELAEALNLDLVGNLEPFAVSR